MLALSSMLSALAQAIRWQDALAMLQRFEMFQVGLASVGVGLVGKDGHLEELWSLKVCGNGTWKMMGKCSKLVKCTLNIPKRKKCLSIGV